MTSLALSPQLPLLFPSDHEARLDTFVWEAAQEALRVHCLAASSAAGFHWLWGRPGAGKTHLLQGIARARQDALYLPASRLLAYEPSCLQSLQQGRLLLIDDVDLLAQPAWEEPLFCLMQALLDGGGECWFSAALPPAKATFQLADLQSRLQLALVFEVQELGDEAKAAALVARAARRGIELRDEVLQFILARNTRSMHDLALLLDRLDHSALAEQRRVTVPFVKSVMGW